MDSDFISFVDIETSSDGTMPTSDHLKHRFSPTLDPRLNLYDDLQQSMPHVRSLDIDPADPPDPTPNSPPSLHCSETTSVTNLPSTSMGTQTIVTRAMARSTSLGNRTMITRAMAGIHRPNPKYANIHTIYSSIPKEPKGAAHSSLISILSPSLKSNFRSFIYEDGFDEVNLTLTDEATITSSGALRLTDGHPALWGMGHAFYHVPLQFKHPPTSANTTSSFNTQFVFAIVSEIKFYGGNGLAFAVTPSMLSNTTGGDYLGLVKNSTNGDFSNHVFAVEFDTSLGTWLKDINGNHVGVDINGVISNTSQTAAYSTDGAKNESIDLKSGSLIKAWIDYDGSEKLINVTIAPVPYSSKPVRPLISYSVDLFPILLDLMYVGFTFGTSRFVSEHYILAWSFAINGKAQELDLSNLPRIRKKTTTSTRISVYSIAFTLFVYRKKKLTSERVEDWERDDPHRLSYREIFKATKGFNEKEILGRGGFGSVYKGVLPSNGTEVAVKKVSHDRGQGLREFVSEVSSLGRLRHRNLVQLQGWCRRKGDLLLVYDFMPNGSLDTFLFGTKKRNLNWEERFRIIKGIASGLLYLHEGWEEVVVYRDVKASNVLLDAQLNGKLGDFGLARLYDHGTNPQTTNVVGTLGYMAPELPITGRATTSSDVFSFEVFLLEMAYGRRPVEPTRPSDEAVFLTWVNICRKKENLLCVMDEWLGMEFDKAEAELVLNLGVLCSQMSPEARPRMRQVVQFLNGSEVPLLENLQEVVIQNEPCYDQLVIPCPSWKSSPLESGSDASRDLPPMT
ncbi:L-type lectin-domain containing receptor kinase S.4-like [Nymphaea colorata]|nr:L-type lectin-domain containing receptor kinase S.4-like [Nymphaea colorata]